MNETRRLYERVDVFWISAEGVVQMLHTSIPVKCPDIVGYLMIFHLG